LIECFKRDVTSDGYNTRDVCSIC